MLIPTHVDVLLPTRPIANYCLIGVISIFSIICLSIDLPYNFLYYFACGNETHFSGNFLSVFVHGDIFHLGGNMLYQWVFGNAICSKIGNRKYLLLYFGTALGAALLHGQLSDIPAIGASGAINGIIGFYFVIYPRNYIYVFYWFFAALYGHTRIPGYFLIILWFAVDIFGAVFGDGDLIAYGAHLGGFATGMATAVFFLKYKWIRFHKIDREHLFPKIFDRINVDEIKPEMICACQYLGEREFLARVGVMDETSYPATVLSLLMLSNKAKGDDEILNPLTNEWELFSQFFGDMAETLKSQGKLPALEVNKPLNIKKYHIHRNGENFGPYELHELKELLNNQEISLDELLVDEKEQKWLKLRELFPHAN